MKCVDSWVVVGVLTVIKAYSGQSYYYTCNQDLTDRIVKEPTYKLPVVTSKGIMEFHDDIVATTANYFDKFLPLLTDEEGPKTFVCASFYKKPEDRRHRKVIFYVKYRMNDKIVGFTMQSEIKQESKGIVLKNCDECPVIVDKAYAYRFFDKGGVYAGYTCSRNTNLPTTLREGYIKASFSLTRNADGTAKKELSEETKALIEEAKAKAKELGIDIVEDVQYGCNTEPSRADQPPTGLPLPQVTPNGLPPPQVTPTGLPPPQVTPTGLPPPQVTPTERSPTNVSPASTGTQ